MRELVRMREALIVAVEHQVDRALRPARHGLRLVLADLAESQAREQARQIGCVVIVGGKLQKLDAEALRARRDLRRRLGERAA